MAKLVGPNAFNKYDPNALSQILQALGVDALVFEHLRPGIQDTVDDLNKQLTYRSKEHFKHYVDAFKSRIPHFKAGMERAQASDPTWFRTAMISFFGYCSPSASESLEEATSKKRRRHKSMDGQQDALGINSQGDERKTAHRLTKRSRQGSVHGEDRPQSVDSDEPHRIRGLSILMNEAHITPVPNPKPLRLKVWIQSRPVQAFVEANAIKNQLGQYCPATLLSYLARTKPEQFPPTSSWTFGISDPKESGPTAWWFKIEDTKDFDYTIRSHAEGCQYPDISITLIEEETKRDPPPFSNNNGGDNSNDGGVDDGGDNSNDDGVDHGGHHNDGTSNDELDRGSESDGRDTLRESVLGNEAGWPDEEEYHESIASETDTSDAGSISPTFTVEPWMEREVQNEDRQPQRLEYVWQVLRGTAFIPKLHARVDFRMVDLVKAYLPRIDRKALLETDRIALPFLGLNPSFGAYPFQIFGAILAFSRMVTTDVPGIILADAPGTGKTITALLLHALRMHYALNVKSIRESAYEEDGNHLGLNAAPGESCPVASEQGIACQCTYHGRTMLYTQKLVFGPSLAIVSPDKVRSFDRDFRKVFNNRTLEGWLPRLAIHHNGQGSGNNTPLSDEEVSFTCRKLSFVGAFDNVRAQTINGRIMPGQVVPESLTQVGPKPPESHRYRSLENVCTLIVATRQSFHEQVLERYNVKGTATWQSKGDEAVTKTVELEGNSLHVGLLISDEYDQAPNAAVYHELFSNQKRHSLKNSKEIPAFVAIAGTADRLNPLAAIQHFVDALHSRYWNTIPAEYALGLNDLQGLRGIDPGVIDTMITTYNDLREGADIDEECVVLTDQFAQFINFFRKVSPACVISCQYDTKWFNGRYAIPRPRPEGQLQRILWEPKNSTTMNEAYRRYIWRRYTWKHNPRRRGRQEPTDYDARVAAVLPSLVRYWSISLKHGTTSLCPTKALEVKGWVEDPFSPEFRFALGECNVTRTGKVKWVLDKCDNLENQCANNRNPGRRVKVIIASGIPLVRATLRSVLSDRYGHEALGVIDGDQDDDQMNVIMDEWNKKEDMWIIIANYGKGGAARNMERASCVIIMEPTYRLSDSESLVEQVGGIAQVADTLEVYTLMSNDSLLEVSMMQSIVEQKRIQESVRDITRVGGGTHNQVGEENNPINLLSSDDEEV